MISFALYSLWLRKMPAGLHPLGVLTTQLLIAALALLPFMLWEYGTGNRATWNYSSLSGVLYVALVPSLLATFIYMVGVARVGAARAALFIHLIPIYGAVLATLFLGEALHAYHFAGLGIILAGLAFSNRKECRPGSPRQAVVKR